MIHEDTLSINELVQVNCMMLEEVLTPRVLAGFCVIHHEGVRLRRRLVFQPVPFMIWVVRQVVHFSPVIWYDSVSRDKVSFTVHGASNVSYCLTIDLSTSR